MRLALIALISAAGLAAPALAHPEGHDMFQDQRRPVVSYAREAVVRLITQSRLPASWSSATVTGPDIRTVNGAQQWVYVFENSAVQNPAQRKLYVLMAPDGTFISASHRPG
jgi:hypothetical protein